MIIFQDLFDKISEETMRSQTEDDEGRTRGATLTKEESNKKWCC